jgi:diacylglycerol kinase family enzyme
MAEGRGLAIVVNANAKRGGRRVAAEMRRILPAATIRLTRDADELTAWLRKLRDKSVDHPECILAAGGDGSAIALVNAVAKVFPDGELPKMGVIPLGTGNGWARSLGAPKLDKALRALATHEGPLIMRRQVVFDCEGTLAQFAGSGYDSMILEDYKKQLKAGGPLGFASKSVYGYVTAMITRTAPRVFAFGIPKLVVENLGDEAHTIDASGKLIKIHGIGRGSILYRGPAGCASVGTSPEFGYGFRAFPFAERYFGRLNVRIFDRGPLKALGSAYDLWRGTHPLPGLHDFFTTGVRMTFSRPMPLQIAGDAVGTRQSLEYRVYPRELSMLDWRST